MAELFQCGCASLGGRRTRKRQPDNGCSLRDVHRLSRSQPSDVFVSFVEVPGVHRDAHAVVRLKAMNQRFHFQSISKLAADIACRTTINSQYLVLSSITNIISVLGYRMLQDRSELFPRVGAIRMPIGRRRRHGGAVPM